MLCKFDANMFSRWISYLSEYGFLSHLVGGKAKLTLRLFVNCAAVRFAYNFTLF